MMTVGYVEGRAQALVRGDTVLLLPEPVEPEVVSRLWEALEAPEQGGVVSVVGALTDVAGSLTAVPPFAVVTLDARAREARVAVRGTSAAVRVRAAGGDVEVSGAGVLMWAERVVAEVASVELALDPGPAGDGPVWPLQGGVVRAALLRRALDGGDVATAAPAAAPAAEPAGSAPAAPAAGPAAPAPAEPLGGLGGSDPDAWPLPGQSKLRAPALPAVVAVPSQETLIGGADGDPLPIATISAPGEGVAATGDVPDAAAPDGPAIADGTPDDDETPAPERQEQGEPSSDTVLGGDGDDYDHLFGDTVFRSVEDAAVRLAGDEEGEVDAAPDASSGPAAGPEAPAPDPAPGPAPEASAPPAPPAPPAASDGGLIASIPFGPGAPGTPAAASRAASVSAEPPSGPPAPSGPVDDHDGNTIMTSDLAALREAAGAALPQFGAPAAPGARDVLALECPQGHPNPPTRQQCRTCGVPLDGDPALSPRPPLGRVRIGAVDGAPAGEDQVVELDRDVVVGRRPRSSTTSADRMPRMVTVPSPQKDISRSHVQVTLEEWHVLVEDLATTNGTVLLRPGQKPRRLHPNQKEIVVDGDVLELGDGITLAFEGIW
ncbi:FHA domain-containing protein [Isoptericola sp. NPDC056578]|uniref:FHA domain-containing protein n=1 Tax=unclassified Isoptericola TaxID=2623355 RepID=UPI0036CC3E06